MKHLTKSSSLNTFRILAVDDEAKVLDTYMHILSGVGTLNNDVEFNDLETRLFGLKSQSKRDNNFSITLCRQADEAISAVKSSIEENKKFALCFLDVRMPPGIDGIKTAEALRKLDKDINIAIVTAYSDYNPLEIEARVPPIDKLFYLQKPFHPWEVWQLAVSITAKWNLENELRESKENLERKVSERTLELERSNEELEVDLAKRITAEKRILEYQKQLKMLASELVLAEEKERRRLAEELHDTVGHSLAAIQIKLALIMDQIKDKGLLDKCECLLTMTEEAMDATRSITFEISPPVLHELGFESAIEWYLERITLRFGIKTELFVEPGRVFKNKDIEIFAFRAIQELIVNAVKHSNATTICVAQHVNNGSVTLTVTDDGKGFDTGKLWTAGLELKGYGLFSIRERTNYLEGTVSIESHEGKGTKVSLILPALSE
jgi:signal transduction histidine kinase